MNAPPRNETRASRALVVNLETKTDAANPTTAAAEINKAYGAVHGAAWSTLEAMSRVGDLLIKHSCSDAWIEKHCLFTARTARLYKQVARGWGQIERARTGNALPEPSLRGALKLLSIRWRDYELPVTADTELAAKLPDGRLVLISPSSEHDGFYFIDCLTLNADGSLDAEGWSRPMRQDFLSTAMDVLGVPVANEWTRHDVKERRVQSIFRGREETHLGAYARLLELEIIPQEVRAAA